MCVGQRASNIDYSEVTYLSARGLGFTTTTEKGGVEYTNVRWSRVDECLQDLNFLPLVAENENPHDYYIPENIFYRLCMKAKKANHFGVGQQKKPLEKSRGSFFCRFCGAILRPPFTLCYKHSCQEDMRSKDRKTSKLQKVAQPLDTMATVIYVTRITTECTTVFVSASACNPSFGQGYAHFLKGEKKP